MKKKLIPALIIFGLLSCLMLLHLSSDSGANEKKHKIFIKLDQKPRLLERVHGDHLEILHEYDEQDRWKRSKQTHFGSIQANSGLFKPYLCIVTSSWPEAVAIGDVNNDGRNDVVMVTSFYFDDANDYKLFVFLQDISGKLALPTKYDLNSDSGQSLDLGDFNNDGLKDVVVSDLDGIAVHLQNGTGTLDAAVPFSCSSDIRKVRAADLNDDGLDDVVGVSWSNDNVDVFLQSGGTLSPYVRYTLTYHGYPDLQVGDLNNDNLTDIVVTSFQGTLASAVSIIYQDGAGGFGSQTYYTPSDYPIGGGIGDVDSDGLNDLVVADEVVDAFIQNAAGSLDGPTPYALSVNANGPVIVSDADRDGQNDVLVAHSTRMSVLFQKADQTLGDNEEYDLPYATWLNPHGMAVGDINSDGINDVVFANYNYGLVILYGWSGANTIVLSSPNGGEEMEMNSIQWIGWGTIGDITEVDLYYSTDGGASWDAIEYDLYNDGSYYWTVPYTPSTNCLVKVVAGALESTSMNPFTILDDNQDRLIVTYPNGGEILEENTSHEITWQRTGTVANVRIEFSSDNGANWTDIVATTTNDGSYPWTVPGEVSNQCLIRISDAADGDPVDQSDAVFTIVAEGTATIRVTYPNGGQSLVQGASVNITWATTGTVGNVAIDFTLDNGLHWGSVVSSTANTGSYAWTVPNYESDQCLIRIAEAAGDGPEDRSDAWFSIVKAAPPPPTPNPNPTPKDPQARVYVPSYHVYIGTKVQMSAEPSYDRDGYITAYEWTLKSKPKGSTAKLASSKTMKTSFTADKGGNYNFSLRVKDNDGRWSKPLNFTITASKGIPPQVVLNVERKEVSSYMIRRAYALVKVDVQPAAQTPAAIVQYILQCKTAGGAWEQIDEFKNKLIANKWGTAFSYQYTDQYLDVDKSYTYRVLAVNSDGEVVVSVEKSI